jgi:2-isopropylmalate synthase
MTERIYLFDTTLRDGAQSQGVDFSVDDKRAIARALDGLNIDYVEGGPAPTRSMTISSPARPI